MTKSRLDRGRRLTQRPNKKPPKAGERPERNFGLLGVKDASIGKSRVHVARDLLPAGAVVLASVGQLNAGFGC